jgi:transcriptional regulator GlxA family with amidase domain
MDGSDEFHDISAIHDEKEDMGHLMLHRPESQKLRVGFVVLDRFTLNAFSSFIDAIRLAADTGGRSRQITCGWEIMGVGPVAATCGLQIQPTSALRNPQEFDYIAVCGGNEYLTRNQPQWLTNYLRDASGVGTGLIGLCTGTFNIARAGLLDGYPACVHWNVLEAFTSEFPHIDAHTDRIFIDAGKRISCAGSTGSADLAFHLITRHCGISYASQAMRHMTLAEGRPSETPQPNFRSTYPDLRDVRVRSAIAHMEQRLNTPLGIEEVARRVGLSARQLDRAFRAAIGETPGAFQLRLRLRYGAFLLTHTTDSVTKIAMATGFSDGAHFARQFRIFAEMTPTSFRQRALSVSSTAASKASAS